MFSENHYMTFFSKGYVVENFPLGWSPRLRKCPQLPQEVEMESTLEHSE